MENIKPYVVGASAMLAFLIVLALVVSYSGAYNVAATVPHTSLGYWYLDNTMRHSVAARADSIKAPGSFDIKQESEGFNHYNDHCLMCHGAPGIQTEAGGNMRPDPPPLWIAAKQWNNQELFWIMKYGVKMTGMPAFGQLGDDTLWSIVAFLRQMPNVSTAAFERYLKEADLPTRNSIYQLGDKLQQQVDEASQQAAQSQSSQTSQLQR